MKFSSITFIVVACTLVSYSASAESHWLTVESNGSANTSFLDPTFAPDGSTLTGLSYLSGGQPKSLSLDDLSKGAVLKTQSGQKVVQIQTAKDFTGKEGGAADITLLHQFNLLGGSDFRVLHARIQIAAQGWVMYFESKNGNELFNGLFFQAGKKGIDSVDFKVDGKVIDSESLDQLPKPN